jgi:cation diffusion facilitator family transporter
MSESIHSAVDLLASLIAFYIIRQSSGSPDAKHHYGHGKYENVSGALEAILIISAGLWIIYEAVDKWQNHSSPESLESGMIVMLVSVTINYLISQRMLTVAKQTKSPALEADALHLQTDMWTSGGVLANLLLLQITGWYFLDSIIAIIIALIILKSGYLIIKTNISQLTDVCIPKDEEYFISEIIISHEQVIALCQLRTRFSGSDRHIDMCLTLDKNIQLETAHAVCDQIESKIKHHFGRCDIMIHLEPDNSQKNMFIFKN